MESTLNTNSTETPPTTTVCGHVLAMPYPGRGHINPMLSFCELLLSRKPDILITFVVTEEWLGFLSSDHKPAPCRSTKTNTSTNNIRFVTVPNVIPSEIDRAKDFPGFFEAANTKLEPPFERVLDSLEESSRPTVIVADTFLKWVVGVGSRRNIPVASLWTQSASVYSILYHFELLERNGHFPVDLAERGDEQVDYIPGISPTRLIDLPTLLTGDGRQVLPRALECISLASKAQFFLSTSFYELEPLAVEALRYVLSGPVYSVGPTIPFSKLTVALNEAASYLQWLDSQPSSSVLYVSLGSFLSVSKAQLEEIIAGIRESGVRFLWVARGDTSLIKDAVGYEGQGLIIPWSDQLRVLCHDSVGGFWTHCGWNSTLEAIFSGVPMLTCPIFWDQTHNSKQIVEDWKIGLRVRKTPGCGEDLVTRQEISRLVSKLMDPNNEEGKEMRNRAKELQHCCVEAIVAGGGGSSDMNLNAFIRDILTNKP